MKLSRASEASPRSPGAEARGAGSGAARWYGMMDANEYFLITATARDRIDDLLASTEIAIERAAISDRRGPTEAAHICNVPGCALEHLPV